MEENRKKESFRSIMKQRFKMRLERTLGLLKHDPPIPTPILEEEISLLLEAAIGLCGPTTLSAFARNREQELRIQLGFCPHCEEEPNFLPLGENLCITCNEQVRPFFDEKDENEH